MNPTARSKQYLEKQGYTVCKVEQKIKFPIPGKGVAGTILRDAFNFGDLLYMGNGVIGLCQSTVGAKRANRISKIQTLTEARKWLECSGKILVHGWAKRGPKGGRKVWSPREAELLLQENSFQVTGDIDGLDLGSPSGSPEGTQAAPKRQRRAKSNPSNGAGHSTEESPGLFEDLGS